MGVEEAYCVSVCAYDCVYLFMSFALRPGAGDGDALRGRRILSLDYVTATATVS